MLQLRALHLDDGLVYKIVDQHLDLLQKRDFRGLTRILGVPVDEILRTHLGPQTPGLLASTHPGSPYAMGGVGEGIDDLQSFDPDAFVEALF